MGEQNGRCWIRICIDQNPVILFSMRERCKLPTGEDAIAKFGNIDAFSKFDVKKSFDIVKVIHLLEKIDDEGCFLV